MKSRRKSPAGERCGEARGDLQAAIGAVEAGELRALRHAIGARVGPETEPLESYRRAYERTTSGPIRPIAISEVVENAARADVVLVGDYHTLTAAQRAALGLARVLQQKRGRIVLGLEMVRSEHQDVIDAYAAGRVGESALRNLIGYDARWPFAWSSYRPLLEFGRQPGVRLLALDGRGGLAARDRRAADRLAASRASDPDLLHLVLVGDLHLAPPHLPALLTARRPSDRLVVIHQNIPAVYAELAGLGTRERAVAAEMVGSYGEDAGSETHYCWITATPVARERSYLAWLDGADSEEALDPVEELGRIVDRFAALLEVPAIAAGVRGVEVVVRGAAGFLRDLEARGTTFARLVGIRRQIVERGVAVAGPDGPIYIGHPDAQHFAAAAAGWLQARAGEPALTPERQDARWREADLLAGVRREAFAVLAWRLVEPLAGVIEEPFAVAFDPAAGPPEVNSTVRVERRARALRARVAAHLAGRRRLAVPPPMLAEPPAVRAAIARAAGAYYADGIRDALLSGQATPAEVAELLAPADPAGRPRERRAVLALASLARAARRAGP
jgi:hypothetical protein